MVRVFKVNQSWSGRGVEYNFNWENNVYILIAHSFEVSKLLVIAQKSSSWFWSTILGVTDGCTGFITQKM